MGALVRVVEAAAPIVSLEDARKHLIEIPEEDEDYVKVLISAATAWIDGPTGWLGRALGVQTLEFVAPDFYSDESGCIPLPFSPVLEVVSVRYRGVSGGYETAPAEEYDADIGGVYPVSGAWPFVSGRRDGVVIRYKVGCARRESDDTEWISAVPEPIRFAILLLVAHWYKNREPVVIGAAVNNLPFTVDALLQPYRIYR